MKVNGLAVGLNMPTALASVGSGETEFTHQLPPYHRRKAFLVDEYPACPPEWLRSSGRTKSYFVPIIEDAGLWLDFNACLNEVPQHVAIIVSVQGVNAITGLPCNNPQPEQYRDECPKHKKAFGPDRLCAECGYKWPKQNYISSAATPDGQLWLDGFRATDGKIRQYVLTAQKERGVAKAVIGEERVHALGLSFFLTKEKRPAKPVQVMRSAGHSLMSFSPGVDSALYDKSCDLGAKGLVGDSGPMGPPGASVHYEADMSYSAGPAAFTMSVDNSPLYKAMAPQPSVTKGTKHADPRMMSRSASKVRLCCAASTDEPVAASFMAAAAPMRSVNVKKLEIAAGARIDQRVYDDPNTLEAYNAEPEGLIIVNYCSEAEADAIIAAGKTDLSGSKEGFLKNVPTGNPV